MPKLVAQALSGGRHGALDVIACEPPQPPTNIFHPYLHGIAEAVAYVREQIAAQKGCWLFDQMQPAGVPGWSLCELSLGDCLLAAEEARVPDAFRQRYAALDRASGPAGPATVTLQ